MIDEQIHSAIQVLRVATKSWVTPFVTEMSRHKRDPFRVLISTILSLRTQDKTTAAAAPRLFALADTPQKMVQLKARQIEKAIYPVGFYRVKTKSILKTCRELIRKYGGRVPDDLDELVALPGVGRKTANLVLTQGFGKLGICVDTHVHRITNRWGYIKTKTPAQTEMALRSKLPTEYWIEINDHLVTLGQNICHPTSPRCSICPVAAFCSRVGVKRSR
jgi:endonuclease III